ncbi:MAG: hypothetical protein KDA49_09035 [Rhodospirillaceae bacterium]|nr:hypothetical protein [Rhodospirillaceae bacterium]
MFRRLPAVIRTPLALALLAIVIYGGAEWTKQDKIRRAERLCRSDELHETLGDDGCACFAETLMNAFPWHAHIPVFRRLFQPSEAEYEAASRQVILVCLGERT